LISNTIRIFPNPANHIINISFSETVFCNELEIWDLNGRLMYSELINEKRKDLKVSDINIPTGVYVIGIATEEQVFKGKFSFYK